MDSANRSRRRSIPSSMRLFLDTPAEEGTGCQTDKPRGYSDASTASGGEDSESIAEPPARPNVHPRQRGNSFRYKHDFAKVIKRAMKLMQESELVTHVQKTENSQACSLTLQMSATGCSQQKRVLALAQKALLDAADPSKSIYVLGYCSSNAFTSSESGFETTFVAMENATTACWHLFKKGKCRHGPACCKRHPSWTMPTCVLVEGEPRAAPEAIHMYEMKIEY